MRLDSYERWGIIMLFEICSIYGGALESIHSLCVNCMQRMVVGLLNHSTEKVTAKTKVIQFPGRQAMALAA